MKAGTGWRRATEIVDGVPRGASERRDGVKTDPVALGVTTQPPLEAPGPSSLPYVEEIYILHIFWGL